MSGRTSAAASPRSFSYSGKLGPFVSSPSTLVPLFEFVSVKSCCFPPEGHCQSSLNPPGSSCCSSCQTVPALYWNAQWHELVMSHSNTHETFTRWQLASGDRRLSTECVAFQIVCIVESRRTGRGGAEHESLSPAVDCCSSGCR